MIKFFKSLILFYLASAFYTSREKSRIPAQICSSSYMCCIHIYTGHIPTQRQQTHTERHMKKGSKETSLQLFTSHFIARFEKGYSKFVCERMLETEHKLHILTPQLWPSRCVFLVLLMLGSTPSGLSEGPLGRVWPSLPHLISSCLEFYWQLLPRSGVAFPTTSGL